VKRAVVDASVILKWYLPDEVHGETALHLLDLYIADKFEILAPSLLGYEVINGLEVARRRGRIPENTILSALEGFFNLAIPLKTVAGYLPEILYYCKTYQRSAYDASYLALAEMEQVILITADGALHNSVKKELKWVHWIGDLKASGVRNFF